MIYKTISLWNPWATAMALGLKKNETRGWSTQYRGDLAIHAAVRKITGIGFDVCRLTGIDPATLAFGKVLCVVELWACYPTEAFNRPELRLELSSTEKELGNYSHQRYVWLTRNLRKLKEPILVKGHQGFFSVEIPDNLFEVSSLHSVE